MPPAGHRGDVAGDKNISPRISQGSQKRRFPRRLQFYLFIFMPHQGQVRQTQAVFTVKAKSDKVLGAGSWPRQPKPMVCLAKG